MDPPAMKKQMDAFILHELMDSLVVRKIIERLLYCAGKMDAGVI